MGKPLKILGLIKSDPKLTPAMISKRLHLAYSTVGTCLWIFKDVGLVKNVDHGLYALTEFGLRLLNGGTP